MSHRDLTMSHLDETGIAAGLSLIIKYRATEIGWKIHINNGDREYICGRCIERARHGK